MASQPTIVERTEQPYVGIRRSVTMDTMGEIVDCTPVVFDWLAARGVEPADAPFFRYHVIDMMRRLEVEVGVPVAEAVAGEGEVQPGVLPAGRYVTVTHTGHPDSVLDATTALLEWAAKEGLKFDVVESADGDRWASRIERYLTDPAEEPDLNKWETELAFKLAD